jgi:hypothetical protein
MAFICGQMEKLRRTRPIPGDDKSQNFVATELGRTGMAINPRQPENVVSPLMFGTVAANQTVSKFGFTGRVGDYLKRLIIAPAAAAAGSVTLLDGATSIPIFVGDGTLADLRPVVVNIDAKSLSGAWSITTGASVSVMVVGDFAP